MNWIQELRRMVRVARGGVIYGATLENMFKTMTEPQAEAMVRVLQSVQEDALREGARRAKRQWYPGRR